MKKLKFVWIDDNPIRNTAATNFKVAENVSVVFHEIKSKKLEDAFGNNEPDLVIMDHNLEHMKSGEFQTGSTATALIRETWPECPVICVTGVSRDLVDAQKMKYYEDLFEINKISKYYSSIISVAKGFRYLKEKRPKDAIGLLKLLKAPELDTETLL